MKNIDLRSDTVTLPTLEMREAMYKAEVGDDVYGEDPTINKLEEYAAGLVGKEAALFVPSGTFGNQLALLTHCQRGDEVLLGEDCHILCHEVGAASVIAGVQLRTFSNAGSTGLEESSINEIQSMIRGGDIHEPNTGLICLENAHSNGRVMSIDYMKKVQEVSKKYNIPIHLDGARIFNAAIHLGVNAKEIANLCDSVMFCLSKGLCAPVGSILAGNKIFINRARKGRKLMGGGLRQAGFLAAAGIVALDSMITRLKEDHENAIFLGTELSKIPGIKVKIEDININMVFLDITQTEWDANELTLALQERGIKVNPPL
jgi:threonine aldolase